MENPNQKPEFPLDTTFGLIFIVGSALVGLDRITSYIENTLPIINDPTAAFIITVTLFYLFGEIARPWIERIFKNNLDDQNLKYWEIGNDGETLKEIREKDKRYRSSPKRRRENRETKRE